MDSPGDGPRDIPAASGSGSDADDSAAHIAELVRRSGERDALPGPSSVAVPDKTITQPPVTAPPVAEPSPLPVARQAAQPVTQRITNLFTHLVAGPLTNSPAEHGSGRVRPAMRKPPLWALVTGGAVAIVLIATGFTLSHSSSPPATPPTALGRSAALPADVVRATDVITDCAGHSHGSTKKSFEAQNCVKATRSLTTGQVSGRPALFVVSRIQMKSAEAAASIKQVLDANGTGNLNDLLREGKTYPGAPEAMPDSGYASVQKGALISVAEAGFTDGGLSSNTDPALRAAAARMANR